MHCSKGMLKARVLSARVNKVSEAQLLDVTKPLKKGMGNDIKDQLTTDVNKSIDGVINDFLFVQRSTASGKITLKIHR